MIRPIQVAPLSQTRMISENPLAPNTMTNEQYLANQFASVGSAPPVGVPRQTAQPVSPVAGLTQLGEAGLEGSRNQQRTASKVSQKVGGLLGGGETAGGLLGNVEGEAALQGLFATMQAIGRPVRRGEDRYLGAVQYGQGVMQQAQKQGLGDLTARMQLEKFELDRAAKLKEMSDRERLQGMLSGGMGRVESNERPPINDLLSQRYDAYEIGQLTDAEKQDAIQAMRLDEAAQMASSMNRFEEAENYRKQAESINQRLGTKFLSREKRTTVSYDRRDQWDKTEYRPRVEQVAKARQLVELAKNPNAITDISMIFGLMKSLDPRSTVREGEADMVESAQGAYRKLMNIQEKLANGRLLPDEAYPDIIESALTVAEAVEKDYKAAVENRISGIEEEGLKADIIIPYKTLGAPDVDATLRNLRQTLNLEPVGGGQVDNPASALKSIKTRGGVTQ